MLQSYESEVGNEYVIRGNSALLKCGIPSYVADLVYTESWLDDAERTYLPRSNEGIQQLYAEPSDSDPPNRNSLLPNHVPHVLNTRSFTTAPAGNLHNDVLMLIIIHSIQGPLHSTLTHSQLFIHSLITSF